MSFGWTGFMPIMIRRIRSRKSKSLNAKVRTDIRKVPYILSNLPRLHLFSRMRKKAWSVFVSQEPNAKLPMKTASPASGQLKGLNMPTAPTQTK
jgi:hypothetical protein